MDNSSSSQSAQQDKMAPENSALITVPTARDDEEQALRIEELGLKIKELKKADYKKISTWTGMMAILVAVTGIFAQGVLYEIKNAKADKLYNETKVKTDSVEKKLKQDSITLTRTRENLKLNISYAKKEFETYKLNIAATKRALDSITRVNLSEANPASKHRINQLLKHVEQQLNTEVQSRPIVNTPLATSSASNTGDKTGIPGDKPANNPPSTQPDATGSYPNDPQKGKWGMLSERNGRKIFANVAPASKRGYYDVTITVTSTDDKRPLTDYVTFHLHNTFRNPNPKVPVRDHAAVLKMQVFGGFTVGAEADNGQTKLELDLALIPGVPQGFKDN